MKKKYLYKSPMLFLFILASCVTTSHRGLERKQITVKALGYINLYVDSFYQMEIDTTTVKVEIIEPIELAGINTDLILQRGEYYMFNWLEDGTLWIPIGNTKTIDIEYDKSSNSFYLSPYANPVSNK